MRFLLKVKEFLTTEILNDTYFKVLHEIHSFSYLFSFRIEQTECNKCKNICKRTWPNVVIDKRL
jgi:hypothetical protein